MGPYTAAQLHKLDLYPGFGEDVMQYLHDPTPFMPPSRLYWTRRLMRPCMDPEDADNMFDVQVLRGELIRFGDTPVQYHWSRHDGALPSVARGLVRTAPRHAWCMMILNTNQDGDFWEQWRQRYHEDWPFVKEESVDDRGIISSITGPHPELSKYCAMFANLAMAWMNQERCYVGDTQMEEISELTGRNIVSYAERDRMLTRLRQWARERNLSFAWAI